MPLSGVTLWPLKCSLWFYPPQTPPQTFKSHFLHLTIVHTWLLHCAVACWVCCCICVVTLCVLTQGVCEATAAPACLHTHVLMPDCAFLCATCALRLFICTPLSMCERVFVCAPACVCVCLLPDLCYSVSIVNESVEQDPDPPAGTNQTHSSGLNGQLTIREPLWPCLLVRHS